MNSWTVIAAAWVLLLAARAGGALEIVPYSVEAMEDARRNDAPIALHFHSDWCSTCRQQRKAFEQLRSAAGLELTLLIVDFDTDDDAVSAFGVPVSSVLIVMHGDVERARLIGVTDRDELAKALREAF